MWSYKVEFLKHSFEPNLAKIGIKKWSLSGDFCPQICLRLGVEIKSEEKLHLKWSYKEEYLKPSFGPNLAKTWRKKWSLSGVFNTCISPSLGVKVKSGEKLQLKSSFAVKLLNPS